MIEPVKVSNGRAGPHAASTGMRQRVELESSVRGRLWLWRKPLNNNWEGHWREPTYV